MLLDVVLGQWERYEGWLEMGRDLVRRGLRSPMLVVTDGTPGLIRVMDELWAGQRPAAVCGAPLAERGRQAAQAGGGLAGGRCNSHARTNRGVGAGDGRLPLGYHLFGRGGPLPAGRIVRSRRRLAPGALEPTPPLAHYRTDVRLQCACRRQPAASVIPKG